MVSRSDYAFSVRVLGPGIDYLKWGTYEDLEETMEHVKLIAEKFRRDYERNQEIAELGGGV